jgi:hypothetical protein
MIYLYNNCPNIEFWLQKITTDFEHVRDYQQWLSYPKSQRVSMHEEIYFDIKSVEYIQDLQKQSGLCIIFVPEMINDFWCDLFDFDNVVFFTAGKINSNHKNMTAEEQAKSTATLAKLMENRLFAEFYQSICAPDWPTLDEFSAMDSKPIHIVEEILCTIQRPVDPMPDDSLDQLLVMLESDGQQLRPKFARIFQHNYFFWSTVDFYHSRPGVLDKLTQQLPKPYSFDVLLGRRKKHRDLVFEQVDRKRNIVKYFDHDENKDLRTTISDEFAWPTDILPKWQNSIVDTADIVVVEGVIVSLSQIVPTDIYNQTAYSLVCESQHENLFSFFTEKIVKPMIAKRLFLVVSGRQFLHNLRQLGFKTFDGIVDESYDQEWNLQRRIQMVMQEMNRISRLDQEMVYQQIMPILEHNYNLIMNHPWQQQMCDDLNAVLSDYVDK